MKQTINRICRFFHSGAVLVAVSALLFACKGTLIKFIYSLGAGVEDVMMLRLLFAMPVYVWVGAHCLRREHHTLDVSQLAGAGLVGVMGYYLASYLDLKGLETISAGLERIILYTYPVFVILLSAALLKRAVSLPLCLCIAVTYIGLLLAFYADVHGRTHVAPTSIIAGSLYVVLSAMAFAVYVIGSDYYMRVFSSALFTAVAMLAAAGVMTLHYLLVHPPMHLMQLPDAVYLWCGVTALVFTVLPSFMMSAGVRQVGSAKAGGIGMIGPVATVLVAAVALGEHISLLQIVGLVIVMLGVYRMHSV